MCAKFHFVDLAGSERANRTGNVGERFKGNAYSRWYHCFLIYFVNDVFCSLKKVLLVCASIIFCVNICSWLEHLGMLSCMYCCYQKSVTCKHYVMHFLGLVTSSVGFKTLLLYLLVICIFIISLYPCDAMLVWVLAMARPCVCLSVCLSMSVASQCSVKQLNESNWFLAWELPFLHCVKIKFVCLQK